LELDQNADIISYEEYYPFGTTSYRSGRSETEVSQKRYKYVMKELDNERRSPLEHPKNKKIISEKTGLYYYGARYYAAWIARFISVDPKQHEYPYLNPYHYAENRPIVMIDPQGMDTYFYDKNYKLIGVIRGGSNDGKDSYYQINADIVGSDWKPFEFDYNNYSWDGFMSDFQAYGIGFSGTVSNIVAGGKGYEIVFFTKGKEALVPIVYEYKAAGVNSNFDPSIGGSVYAFAARWKGGIYDINRDSWTGYFNQLTLNLEVVGVNMFWSYLDPDKTSILPPKENNPDVGWLGLSVSYGRSISKDNTSWINKLLKKLPVSVSYSLNDYSLTDDQIITPIIDEGIIDGLETMPIPEVIPKSNNYHRSDPDRWDMPQIDPEMDPQLYNIRK